jgi:hypothetical protein
VMSYPIRYIYLASAVVRIDKFYDNSVYPQVRSTVYVFLEQISVVE